MDEMNEVMQDTMIEEVPEQGVAETVEDALQDEAAEEGVKQSPPWHFCSRSLQKMFERDKEIEVVIPEHVVDSKFRVVVRCGNYLKCCALRALLPANIPMGNIAYSIDIEFTEAGPMIDAELIRAAFKGNDIVREIIEADETVPFSSTFCVFQKEVLQFYNDDLTDPNGNVSVLAHDIANNMFNRDNSCVNYCISEE